MAMTLNFKVKTPSMTAPKAEIRPKPAPVNATLPSSQLSNQQTARVDAQAAPRLTNAETLRAAPPQPNFQVAQQAAAPAPKGEVKSAFAKLAALMGGDANAKNAAAKFMIAQPAWATKAASQLSGPNPGKAVESVRAFQQPQPQPEPQGSRAFGR